VLSEYNTYEQHPWHGAGQGAADAALHYIALLDVLIDAYHERVQPSTIHDLTGTIAIIKSIKAFINDVAMLASTQLKNFQEQRIKAQAQLQWWHQLIQVTGGKLNPKKCCSAAYAWYPDKLGILQLVQLNPNKTMITLSDTNPHESIPTLKRLEGTHYLGVYLALDGSMMTMEMQLWQKAVMYMTAFQCTPVSRHEARVFY